MEKKPAILVVEDETEIAELIAEFLESEGFRVSTAGDGWQAVVQAEGMKIDLIVVDLAMPGPQGTGLHAFEKLRRSWIVKKDLPIIFITALPKAQVEARLRLDARCRLLYKPVPLPVLRDTIRELLGV